MELSSEMYESIIEQLHDGLYFVDRERVITYWNRAAERISGFPAEEVVGHACYENILTHVDDVGRRLCHGMCPLAKTIADGEPRTAEVYMHHKDGHRIPVSIRVSPLRGEGGEIIGGIELFTDISHVAARELRVKELEDLAFIDGLTRMANRYYLERELANRLRDWQEFGTPFGVLFMDIDGFKRFNDSYGHAVGDRVLGVVAKTLIANSRPFDVYGRWGGEEFIGVIRNIREVDLGMVGERVRWLVEKSYVMHEGSRLGVTISVGVTGVGAEDTVESVVGRADELLYRSKAAGANRVTVG